MQLADDRARAVKLKSRLPQALPFTSPLQTLDQPIAFRGQVSKVTSSIRYLSSTGLANNFYRVLNGLLGVLQESLGLPAAMAVSV
jgi:hypothetical protein